MAAIVFPAVPMAFATDDVAAAVYKATRVLF